MTNQEEQVIMDSIYGKSYDDRWHTVITDTDLEIFKLPIKKQKKQEINISYWNKLDLREGEL